MLHTSSCQKLNHSIFEGPHISKVISKTVSQVVLWLSFLLIGILLIPVGILMLLVSGIVSLADFLLARLEKDNY